MSNLRALTKEEVDTVVPIIKALGHFVDALNDINHSSYVWLALRAYLDSFEKEHGYDPAEMMILPHELDGLFRNGH